MKTVRFKTLAHGARFCYPNSDKVFVKLDAHTIAEWDEKNAATTWNGQGIYAAHDPELDLDAQESGDFDVRILEQDKLEAFQAVCKALYDLEVNVKIECAFDSGWSAEVRHKSIYAAKLVQDEIADSIEDLAPYLERCLEEIRASA